MAKKNRINIKLSDFEKWLDNLDDTKYDFSKTGDVDRPYKKPIINLILAGFIGGYNECLRIENV